MLPGFLLKSLAAGVAGVGVALAQDPCTVATSSLWVTSKQAHACELNVPFDKARSLSVVDSAIKFLQYYSLETWFLHSPNPLIPHDVNVRALLTAVQKKTNTTGYPTDWDFNIAVTDAFDREADGHTIFEAGCTASFSWNLPVSIATLAQSPFDSVAVPTLLVNYDFPNQARPGLEDFYESLGIFVRPLDGAKIVSINGQDASTYLVNLATSSSIFDGLFGSYETVEPRYMRLMSRYSADTVSGAFTLEVGRFGQRPIYPGADSVKLTVQLKNGTHTTVTLPWAATFIGAGNDTASFIAENCLPAPDATERRAVRETRKRSVSRVTVPPLMEKRQAVIKPDAQIPVRQQAVSSSGFTDSAPVTPNLTSFGHITTIDIYQLKESPKVGVVYFEQFEPSDGTDFETYFNEVSAVLFDGLNGLKAAGVEKVLIDISGNRGGFIFAGAIALWSLWPEDLFPGFLAVFRDHDLVRRESDAAAATNDQNSEYNFRFYRDPNYNLLTSNAQFLDPPVPQVVNGVKDAFSQHFIDDFGDNSTGVTNFTTPPFQGEDYVIVSNSICASTCSVFSSYLFQKHNVRSAVFGGQPVSPIGQFDGGVKGSEVTDFTSVLGELQLAGLQDDPDAPQPFPISADLTMNFRNAIPFIDKQDGILEYVFEQDTKKYHFTPQLFNNPQATWEFVAKQFFPKL